MPRPRDAAERSADLRRQAREHKRAVSFHRERLRSCMEELRHIEQANAALGIETSIVGQPPSEEEVTHGATPENRALHQL